MLQHASMRQEQACQPDGMQPQYMGTGRFVTLRLMAHRPTHGELRASHVQARGDSARTLQPAGCGTVEEQCNSQDCNTAGRVDLKEAHRCRYFNCSGSPVMNAMVVRKVRYCKVACCCVALASRSAGSAEAPDTAAAAAAFRTLSL